MPLGEDAEIYVGAITASAKSVCSDHLAPFNLLYRVMPGRCGAVLPEPLERLKGHPMPYGKGARLLDKPLPTPWAIAG